MHGKTTGRRTAWIARAVSGVGAVYAVVSVLPLILLLVFSGGWVTERASLIRVTTYKGREYSALGLTYTGTAGSVLLWAEIVLVLFATFLSTRRGRIAMGAHAALVAWGALLAIGVWWVVLAADYRDARWMLPIVTVGLALLTARAGLAIGPAHTAARAAP